MFKNTYRVYDSEKKIKTGINGMIDGLYVKKNYICMFNENDKLIRVAVARNIYNMSTEYVIYRRGKYGWITTSIKEETFFADFGNENIEILEKKDRSIKDDKVVKEIDELCILIRDLSNNMIDVFYGDIDLLQSIIKKIKEINNGKCYITLPSKILFWRNRAKINFEKQIVDGGLCLADDVRRLLETDYFKNRNIEEDELMNIAFNDFMDNMYLLISYIKSGNWVKKISNDLWLKKEII